MSVTPITPTKSSGNAEVDMLLEKHKLTHRLIQLHAEAVTIARMFHVQGESDVAFDLLEGMELFSKGVSLAMSRIREKMELLEKSGRPA